MEIIGVILVIAVFNKSFRLVALMLSMFVLAAAGVVTLFIQPIYGFILLALAYASMLGVNLTLPSDEALENDDMEEL